MSWPPRLDHLKDINKAANDYLFNNINKINNNKIVVVDHNLPLQGLSQEDVFGLKTDNRYDGIHLNGQFGKQAITKSLINIFIQSGISRKLKKTPLN